MQKQFAILCALFLIAGFLLILKPLYGFYLRAFFAPTPVAPTPESALADENIKLKTELEVLRYIKDQLPQKSEKSVAAVVYSRYPLNFKSELLINAGTRENIKEGSAVTFKGLLIGRISDIFDETSLVQTIFDEKFQLAVRIGSMGTKALLKGGSLPELTLISPTALIASGDSVYSAAEGIPFGLPVGEVRDIRVSADLLFQSATIEIPYDTGDISAVRIMQ